MSHSHQQQSGKSNKNQYLVKAVLKGETEAENFSLEAINSRDAKEQLERKFFVKKYISVELEN